VKDCHAAAKASTFASASAVAWLWRDKSARRAGRPGRSQKKQGISLVYAFFAFLCGNTPFSWPGRVNFAQSPANFYFFEGVIRRN
jgi:hypothetical protein